MDTWLGVMLTADTFLLVGIAWMLFLHMRAVRARWRTEDKNKARQATMTVRTSSTRVPPVERARTTRRDTGDLPLTGRQSRVAQKRRGGDLLDRVDHDDQLQQRPGGPSA